MVYYVLIKRKGTKKWKGAIPVRKGVPLAKLRNSIGKKIKPSYSFRIVSSSQLKRFLLSMRKKLPMRRKIRKRSRR